MSSYDEDYSLLNRSKPNENEYKVVVTKRMLVFGLASIVGIIVLTIVIILILTT
tara:strand:- start:634 stop:795 length:162 start_codon:yes stop_codon:yes gene_type:complete